MCHTLLFCFFLLELLFEGNQEVAFPSLSLCFWGSGIDVLRSFDALPEALYLVCLGRREDIALRVGIVEVERKVEYGAALDAEQDFAPPREIFVDDACDELDIPHGIRLVHAAPCLAMLHCPALVHVFRVGILCGVVEDVVCDDIGRLLVELIVRLRVIEMQEVFDEGKCAVVAVVGEGNEVGAIPLGCFKAKCH